MIHFAKSLALDEASIARLRDLEAHHRDPFDRMLVCQALQHELVIVTMDPVMSKYPAELLRA